ncbi:uncharacterized protein LTHEOB_1597 [Lasiodiplodia theobromae]|uniref:uncharacterized protein n=1 Tax=Lasiodiplodia theobromae TaxID=45133 RepID=UPI0015C33552|nr:uncharacterized protein LTHEOB_1597 [Lasiodiplodia theobromae]KAF4537406.1 hypothetical protein LTHEOB_1597 [Lasiodiplodia theobromae]
MPPTPFHPRTHRLTQKKIRHALDNTTGELVNEERGKGVTEEDFKKLEAHLSEVNEELKELKLKVMGNDAPLDVPINLKEHFDLINEPKKASENDAEEVKNDPKDYTHHIRFTKRAPFVSGNQFFIIGSAIHGNKKRERKEIGVRVGNNGVNLRIGKKRLTGEKLFTPNGELEDITLYLPRWTPSAKLRRNKYELLKDIKKHLKDEMVRLPEAQRSKVLPGQGVSKTRFFGEDIDSDDEEVKRPFNVDENVQDILTIHNPRKRKEQLLEGEQPFHKRIKKDEHEDVKKRLFSGSMENKQKQEGEKQKRPHEIYSSLFEMLDKTSPFRHIYRKCMEEPGQNLVSRATAEALRRAREQNK